jgi:hypothetical protein
LIEAFAIEEFPGENTDNAKENRRPHFEDEECRRLVVE